MKSWWTFLQERFHPVSHLTMIALFVAANGLLGAREALLMPEPWRFAVAGVIAFSYFLRLRLFDEIKDYETDLEFNPTRPLARGLLKPRDLMVAFSILTALELVLATMVGKEVLVTHAWAVAYSYLMYREFFIGRYLRPHLTTYAVTHTVSSVWLAFSVCSITSHLGVVDFAPDVMAALFANWALFNLFEFARKTFALSEERPNVPSYSKLLGRAGASVLSVSQAGLACLLVLRAQAFSFEPGLLRFAIPGIFSMLTLVSAVFSVSRRAKAASLFRNVSAAALLMFYAAWTASFVNWGNK